ncbi:MAG: hypothetical protein PHV16_02005 [Candidatus Nanoarchaeia archaeon]|nr:hypothetical protein [Candidatus Nanoarchaeia archaeon]
MEIWGLVAIILVIIIILAILKFVFKMVKLVFWIVVILFIITSVMGIFTYKDALDMKENLENEPKLLFLNEGKSLIAGFSVEDFNDAPKFFRFSEIVEYQNYFKKQDYKKMIDESYKMFILDTKAFNLDNKEVDFIGGKVSKETLYLLLKSDDPIELYKSKTGVDAAIYGIEDPAEFKGNIFAVLFNDEFESKGQLFILIEYKKNNVIVYPETASFKMIKLMPTSFINNMFEKVKEKAVQTINN